MADTSLYRAERWEKNYKPSHAIYLAPQQTETGWKMGGPVAWTDSKENADELVKLLLEEEARKPKMLCIIFKEQAVNGHDELLFVEVEDENGKSVHVGEFDAEKSPDGYTVLRIKR